VLERALIEFRVRVRVMGTFILVGVTAGDRSRYRVERVVLLDRASDRASTPLS
jgi:hypothetical protein